MPSGNSHRIAVVGCGGWGQNHVRVWDELGTLAVVCDKDEDRLRAARDATGVPTTTDAADVLDDPSVDAVVLATPAATHARLARDVLASGKHVLVEKPMALSTSEAQRLSKEAADSGLVLMVDHILEYHPAVQALYDLVEAGELGKMLYVSSHRLNFGRVRTEEDILWSFAPHDLSLMLNLVGERPFEVSARGGAYLSRDVSDVTLMTLHWDGDVRGYVFVSWLHPFKEHRFVVVGDQQMAVFDDTQPWESKLRLYAHRVDWMGGRVPIAQRADAVSVALEEKEPLKEACRHFLDCIATGRHPRTGPDNGSAVVELLEAGRRSLDDRGLTISLRGDLSESPLQGVQVHPTATVDRGAQLGTGTKVWHHVHVMGGARIGTNCVLGQDVYVADAVRIGNGVKIQNNVSVYDGVALEDHVFVGPAAVFTNVRNPRSEINRSSEYRSTHVRRGATIGANATVVCPVEIGRYAFVGAGAVVIDDVPAHGLVVGSPARLIGWVCTCGERLEVEDGCTACEACGRRFAMDETVGAREVT